MIKAGDLVRISDDPQRVKERYLGRLARVTATHFFDEGPGEASLVMQKRGAIMPAIEKVRISEADLTVIDPTVSFENLCIYWGLHRGALGRYTDLVPQIEIQPPSAVPGLARGPYLVKVIRPPEDWAFSSTSLRSVHKILALFFPGQAEKPPRTTA